MAIESFDKDLVRKRFIEAVDSLIGKGVGKMYRNKSEYCKVAGHGSSLLGNIYAGRNQVTTQVLFGLGVASKGKININDIVFGKGFVKDLNDNFIVPPDSVVIKRGEIGQAKTLTELIYQRLKNMETN